MYDLTGKRFGKWKVLTPSSRKKKDVHKMWLCECNCGVKKYVSSHAIRNGLSKGCRDCCNGLRPYEHLYNHLCDQAKRRHTPLVVEFSYEYFLRFTKIRKCSYCDSPIMWFPRNGTGKRRATNLDRKDNSLGYTKKNVVVCCGPCNMLRRNHFTHKEFVKVVKVLRRAKLWPKNNK